MKNKERAIVYSLLAVSIFLGLTRPLGTVVADDPPGEATFEKLTIVRPDGKSAVVLDTDEHGAARAVLFTQEGKHGISLTTNDGWGRIATRVDKRWGITLDAGRQGSEIFVPGPNGKEAVSISTSPAMNSLTIFGPNGSSTIDLCTDKEGLTVISAQGEGRKGPTNGLLVNSSAEDGTRLIIESPNGETGIVLDADNLRSCIRTNGADGQSGVAIETSSEGHSAVELSHFVDRGLAEELEKTTDPARAAEIFEKAMKRGVSISSSREGGGRVGTYGPDGNVTGHLP